MLACGEKEKNQNYIPQDSVAPSAPSNLKATVVSSSQIDLTWTASTDNVSVAGYKVYRNDVNVATVQTTSYSDTGLNELTQYCYKVLAYDGTNNVSQQTYPICVSTLAKTGYLMLIFNATCKTETAYLYIDGIYTSTIATRGEWVYELDVGYHDVDIKQRSILGWYYTVWAFQSSIYESNTSKMNLLCSVYNSASFDIVPAFR